MSEAEVITVSSEDAASIAEAEKEVVKAQRDLGALREDYLMTENRIMEKLGQARMALQTAVVETGKKYDVPSAANGQPKYRYDLANQVFVRFE